MPPRVQSGAGPSTSRDTVVRTWKLVVHACMHARLRVDVATAIAMHATASHQDLNEISSDDDPIVDPTWVQVAMLIERFGLKALNYWQTLVRLERAWACGLQGTTRVSTY